MNPRQIAALRACSRIPSNYAVRGMVNECLAEIEQLQTIIQFALDKCACRSAGNKDNPFVYLWKPDWGEFEKRALELLGEDKTHGS